MVIVIEYNIFRIYCKYKLVNYKIQLLDYFVYNSNNDMTQIFLELEISLILSYIKLFIKLFFAATVLQ